MCYGAARCGRPHIYGISLRGVIRQRGDQPVNVVALSGQLVEEPQLRRTRSGEHACRMKIAVPRWSAGGIREPGVVYIDVTVFGLRALSCADLSPGAPIGLSGRLQHDVWRDDSGARRESLWVAIDQLDVTGS